MLYRLWGPIRMGTDGACALLFFPGGNAVPTYEYKCEQCERVYEVRHRISAPPLTTCQYCGGAVHRLLAAAPFILKGSGWYVTDYPSQARKKALETEKKAAPSETSGSSKPSDGAGSSAAKPDPTPSAPTPSKAPSTTD